MEIVEEYSDLNFYIIQNWKIIKSEPIKRFSQLNSKRYADISSGPVPISNMYKIYCFDHQGFNYISMYDALF